MAIHGSGLPIDMDEIAAEFGGNKPYSLSAYIRNGAYVPDAPQNANIPTTLNNISMGDFYGAVKQVTATYEIIGGGGGGAGTSGYTSGAPAGAGGAGGASTISGSGISTITANGGGGGANNTRSSSQAGASTAYGAGGAGGLNSNSGNDTDGFAPSSTAYGAGGGSGGSLFVGGSAGNGGGAGTRLTGSFAVVPSTVIYVTIGGYGNGGYGTAGNTWNGRNGARGASGYAKFTVGGQTFTFTSSGSFTVPS